MKQDLSEDILLKYLLGEASDAEINEVETWVAANTDNAKKLEGIKIILDSSKRLAQTSPLSEAQAWDRFKEKRAAGAVAPAKVRTMNKLWLQAAAAILFFGSVVWFTHQANKNAATQWVTLTAQNAVRVETLPDGSVVHINKNSTLRYADNFASNRTIKLTGEAFFEVKHDEKLRFNVQVNNILIQDIGTAFNVNGRQQATEVIVSSGIVSVSKDKNSVRLTAHEMVSIKNNDRSFKVEQNKDELYDYYRSNSIKGRNTPLARLVEVLNNAYGADIEIRNRALRNIPITVTIDLKDSLPSILNLLKSTTPEIHIEQDGRITVIR
jgi:transmembrane sensor